MSSLRYDPANPVTPSFQRVSTELTNAAATLGSSTLHEASGKRGALPWGIKPLCPSLPVHGPAMTVNCPPGDNLWLHRAIYAAQAGDVLVVTIEGDPGYGYWGEVMSHAARARGIAGLVINGCVRDGQRLVEMGFPVFARGLSMRGTDKDFGSRGSLALPVMIGDVIVEPGDLVVGDGDGVVTVARTCAAKVIAEGRKREDDEQQIMARLASGESTLEIYGLR